ncbi:hypothetical protein WEN_01915 [Mycoplasma wenyonii str. Massachusetts]|uniref:DUF31 domain-containing protein n=1 Tax=Mycoplasma wenyonii (strain Massachusetts) TaxID=1197325 RepID=I6YB29_MYCWM|nr:hypothetical protein [Mycoplasma wenyonii]AFN65176.1 hypothetical protein WEN_01915 [Mycoplasma wenyonii str. Massachusetts]
MALNVFVKWGLPVVVGIGGVVGYSINNSHHIKGSGVANSEAQYNSALDVDNVSYTEEVPQLQETVWALQQSHHPVQEQLREKETNRERIKAEAKQALDKIHEYTFRIFSPCGAGTGWILDYQLPEGNKKYPTVWYIATNAHVIKNLKFSDNPYHQEMNTSVARNRRLRYAYWRNRYEHLSLWDDATCEPANRYGYFDLSLSKSNLGPKMGLDKGMYFNEKILEPRLFYVATNFLKEDESVGVKKENYRDFAILEIEFKDEDYARQVTDGFADKYKVDSTDAINVFAKPLESRYSLEDLKNYDENLYNLGYPGSYMGKKEKFAHHDNFNEEALEAAKLAGDRYNWYYDAGEQRTFGFLDAKRISRGEKKWAGKTKTRVGHFYMVREHKWQNLSPGSSGSMYTDKDGNMLGVKSVREASESGGKHSFITPLRSDRINKGEKGTLLSPAYDLIKGVDGQISSYKSQVETYVLNKNRNTWLNARHWEHITNDNKHTVKQVWLKGS